MTVKFQVYFFKRHVLEKNCLANLYLAKRKLVLVFFILEFIFMEYFLLQKSILEVVTLVGTRYWSQTYKYLQVCLGIYLVLLHCTLRPWKIPIIKVNELKLVNSIQYCE